MLISGHRSVLRAYDFNRISLGLVPYVQRVLIEATDAGADRFHPAFQKLLSQATVFRNPARCAAWNYPYDNPGTLPGFRPTGPAHPHSFCSSSNSFLAVTQDVTAQVMHRQFPR